jgi:hypothetical protein
MCNLYRGSAIAASYQVSVHLAKRGFREDLKKSINQKQEVWWPFAYGSGQNVHSL